MFFPQLLHGPDQPDTSVVVLLVAIAVTMLFGPAGTSAPLRPAAYELAWTAPPGCPSEEQLRERIAELAPNPSGGEGVMFVTATVVQRPTGFTVQIATDFAGHHDERAVESERCTELGDVTALVVAVALESESLGARKPESSKEATPQPFLPEPELPGPSTHSEVPPSTGIEIGHHTEPPASAPFRSTKSKRRRSFSPHAVHLRIAPLLEYGSLPSVDGGTALTVGLLWPRWRAELFGMYLFPQGETFGRTRSLFQLGAAGGRGCHRLFAGRVEFPLCLGIEAGAVRAQTRAQQPRSTLSLGWLAPSARAGLAVGGKRIGFFAAAEVAVATLIPRILVGEQRVFESRAVSLRAAAGLEIFFAIDRG